MTAPTEAYPLTWPLNRPRSARPQRANFRVTFGRSVQDVVREVSLLGGSALIVSSNIALRRDGLPYANTAEPADRGVAVYFTYKRKAMCFACDRWLSVGDNVRAIAKTIEALRGIERWGSGEMIQQAFTGFLALPMPEQPFQVLGVSAAATRAEVEAAHRRLAMEHHPDRGGDSEKMARINAARDQLLETL